MNTPFPTAWPPRDNRGRGALVRRIGRILAAVFVLGLPIVGAPVRAAPPGSPFVLARQAQAPQPGRAARAIGAAERLDPTLAKRLAGRISINWKQVPLRSALDDLAASGRFQVQLDRRVDPDQTVSAELRDVPIAEALAQLAAEEQLGVSLFGPLVVVGPLPAAERLRTLAVLRGAEVAQLPPPARERWATKSRSSWPAFSTPRELLKRLAQEAGTQLSGIERVPHDLWPAAELPPLCVADRLTLLANQFDLTYRLGAHGDQAELVPISPQVVVERRYPAGANPEQSAQRWRLLAPQADVQIAGGQLVVRGHVEEHERILQPADARSPARRPPADPNLVRISRLELTDLPLAAVIEGLGQRLGLTIEMDHAAIESAGVSLDQRVSIDLENATIDDVWRAALEPAGLQFKRAGRTITIESPSP